MHDTAHPSVTEHVCPVLRATVLPGDIAVQVTRTFNTGSHIDESGLRLDTLTTAALPGRVPQFVMPVFGLRPLKKGESRSSIDLTALPDVQHDYPVSPISPTQLSAALLCVPKSNSVRRKSTEIVDCGISSQKSFSKVHKSLLRYSWSQWRRKKDLAAIGTVVFKRFLEQCPRARSVFGFGTIPISQLVYDTIFINHARAFATSINDVIGNLDQEHVVAALFQEQGRYHAMFEEYGFKASYWDDLGQAIVISATQWEGPGRHRETVRAWTVLGCYMADVLRYSYEQEVRRRSRKSSQSSCGGQLERKLSTPPSPIPSLNASPTKASDASEDAAESTRKAFDKVRSLDCPTNTTSESDIPTHRYSVR